MPTLAEIRAKLEAAKSKTQNDQPKRSNDDLAQFPFWNAPLNSTSTVRFLPDADASNAFFWRQRDVINLPFEGVINGDYPTNQSVTVKIISPTTFDMKCPIGAATKHLWKEDKDLALKYWRKRSYLTQAFVVSSAFQEDKLPANPIRRLVLNKGLFEQVEQILMDPEIEDLITDFDKGRDYRIVKTQKGEWSNYSTSSFSMKTRSLGESERAAIAEHGLFDLSSFLGKAPTDEDLLAMEGMVRDSLNGDPFDAAAYPNFRAFSQNGQAPAQSGSTSGETSAPSTTNASEILDRIRNAKSKSAGAA